MIFSDEFIEEVRQKLTAILKSVIPSKTLKAAVSVSYRKLPHNQQLSVSIPHYWATYYHDGSGPITMPKGRYMVWFKDSKDDPRLKGGYPVKRANIRRLDISSKRFTQLVKEGKLIVRRSVGRRKGHPFLPAASRIWGLWIKQRLRRRALEEIRENLDKLKNLKI